MHAACRIVHEGELSKRLPQVRGCGLHLRDCRVCRYRRPFTGRQQQAGRLVIARLVQQRAILTHGRCGDDSPQLRQSALALLGVDALGEPLGRVLEVLATVARGDKVDGAVKGVEQPVVRHGLKSLVGHPHELAAAFVDITAGTQNNESLVGRPRPLAGY